MKNSKVEIYKIITGFILIIGLILGLIAGTNSKSIAVFFLTILSAIILVTFIMGIYSICKRLDILINPKLNIEKEIKKEVNKETKEKQNNNENDKNELEWEKTKEKETKDENKFSWE